MSAFDPAKCFIATASPMCFGVGCRPFETAKIKSCAIDVIFPFVHFESDNFLSSVIPDVSSVESSKIHFRNENKLSGINSAALSSVISESFQAYILYSFQLVSYNRCSMKDY